MNSSVVHGKSHANVGGLYEKVGVPLQANNGMKLVTRRCREQSWGVEAFVVSFRTSLGVVSFGYIVINLCEVKGGHVRAKGIACWFV